MEVVTSYPPNYEEICQFFPSVKNSKTIIFTYGNTIHNPNGGTLTNDLMVHEQTHIKQQAKIGPGVWWRRYLDNAHFRLEQEVEAYRAQYRAMNRQTRRSHLNLLASHLNGSMYGSIISKEEAIKRITEVKST